MEICLDTDILVDILRKEMSTLIWFKENLNHNFYITPITIHELFLGAYKHKKKEKLVFELKQFLSQFTVLQLNDLIFDLSGKELAELELKGTHIALSDLFIGICAREHNAFLKTKNKKHFSKIKGLKLLD